MSKHILDGDSATRKTAPMATGLLHYFPNACAEIARHSARSNEKHNPGEPVHWSFDQSADHIDCVVRHAARAGLFDSDGARESTCLAWRALANLETELIRELGVEPGLSVRRDPPADPAPIVNTASPEIDSGGGAAKPLPTFEQWVNGMQDVLSRQIASEIDTSNITEVTARDVKDVIAEYMKQWAAFPVSSYNDLIDYYGGLDIAVDDADETVLIFAYAPEAANTAPAPTLEWIQQQITEAIAKTFGVPHDELSAPYPSFDEAKNFIQNTCDMHNLQLLEWSYDGKGNIDATVIPPEPIDWLSVTLAGNQSVHPMQAEEIRMRDENELIRN